MALDIEDQEQSSRRPFIFAVLGLMLIVLAAYIVYGTWVQNKNAAPAQKVYSYSINQSVDTHVHYMPNSFFINGPGASNTAYVNELTDKIGTNFHYNFSAKKKTELTYTYDVKAIVSGTYALGGNVAGASNVWSKEYQLIKPKTITKTTDNIRIDPSADMQFAQYKKVIDSFKTAFGLPINTEAKVICTVRVAGTVDGVAFADSRELSVAAPLYLQIYQLEVKYDKSINKAITQPIANKSWDINNHYPEIFSGVMALIGALSLVYGLRRQIFKTAYQRELDRIYRYHDGIIIRANKPADLDEKNVVSVQSFDDMLNLEEELKVPIVASPAGSEAMHFVIIRDDVVYVYTLGKPVLDRASVNQVESELPAKDTEHGKVPRHKN